MSCSGESCAADVHSQSGQASQSTESHGGPGSRLNTVARSAVLDERQVLQQSPEGHRRWSQRGGQAGAVQPAALPLDVGPQPVEFTAYSGLLIARDGWMRDLDGAKAIRVFEVR